MKENKSKYQNILQATEDIFIIWRNEVRRVFRDQGVLVFFILVPLIYPLIYAFIYNNETVREVPAVVVDESHSALSRDFIRRIDASPDVKIVSYCSDPEEARKLMKQREAYGMIRIPSDFSLLLNRGEQATISLYCDMSGLLYYKALLVACTDVSLDMNEEIQIERAGLTTAKQEETAVAPLEYEYVTMFNTTNGFASFCAI